MGSSSPRKEDVVVLFDLAPSRVVVITLGWAVAHEEAMARLRREGENIERVLPIAFDASVEFVSLLGVGWAFLGEMTDCVTDTSTIYMSPTAQRPVTDLILPWSSSLSNLGEAGETFKR